MVKWRDCDMRYLSVTVITFLLAFTSQANANSNETWENDDAWLAFIAQYKEIYDIVEPFYAKRTWRGRMIPYTQYRKWLKLVSDMSDLERNVAERMFGHLRKVVRFNDPLHPPIGVNGIEEVVVVGSLFDQFPIKAEDFSYNDIMGMRGIRMMANDFYRDELYDQAYPLLLQLAKRGFKDSQSRLAYILFTGTDEVAKSNLRALGWLGAAAFGESEPQFRVLFKKFMNEVPESVRPTVDAVVAAYVEEFDASEHVDCTTNHRFHKGSGRVKRTLCKFELEQKVEACNAGRYGGVCWAHTVNTHVDDGIVAERVP